MVLNKLKLSRKTTIVVSILTVLAVFIGSFAFFTDRENKSVAIGSNGKTPIDVEVVPGEVPVDPNDDPDNPSGPTQPWGGVDGQGGASFIMLPGEKLHLPSTISSEGLFAIDVRETFVLSSPDKAFDSDAQFEIYPVSNVMETVNGSYVPTGDPIATGADRVVSNDGKTITYELEPFVLSGTDESIEGNPLLETDKEYILLFNKNSDNSWQSAPIDIMYVLDAKQHTGTSDADWDTISTVQLEINE